MDKEVDPTVLAVINEKRLQGDKRTPVEIITKMGVFDARDKASEYAWVATGEQVIATIWAEFVSVGAGGRWFYLESLDVQHRVGGGERSALQMQRSRDRIGLLKRTMDAGQGFRAVLQTNRIEIAGLEADKAAKVSTRVPDDEEWHIADWNPDEKVALLVRGARGWMPSADELKTARARGSLPPVAEVAPQGKLSHEEVQLAAIDYLMRHFGGYGYKAEDVSAQKLGYDIEVSDKKGNTLLKIASKGITTGMMTFGLTATERATLAKAGDPWRLGVVTDPQSSAVQHKLYRAAEINNAPGLEPDLG